MALTGAQEVTVRRLLGYSGSTNVLDGYFSGIGADVEAAVVALLARIDTLETSIDSFATKSGLYKRVEEIEFRDSSGASMLTDRLLTLTAQLATLLNAPLGPGYDQVTGGVCSGPILRG